MKLTNYIRDAYIAAVMQDVPSKCNHTEEIRKLAQNDILSQLPKDIFKIWTENKESRQYLNIRHDSVCHVSFVYPATSQYRDGARSISIPVFKQIQILAEEMQADEATKSALRSKLKGAAYACTSSKQLRELLPEFERYLPAEEEKTLRTLPAVANIMADFAKAGWPAKKQTKK